MDFPVPPGESPVEYLLYWLARYGWLGLLIGITLLLAYYLLKKAFHWVADRLFQRAVSVHDEWQATKKRRRTLDTATAAYLDHVITHHQWLNLRGIRSSQPVNLSLEDLYISLTTVNPLSSRQAGEHLSNAEDENHLPVRGQPLVVHLSEMMPRHRRLVVLGNPGGGKTTFISYLALTYARHLDGRWPNVMQQRLGYTETTLPILIPLRDFARHIRLRLEHGAISPGPAWLLEFIDQYFSRWNLNLPPSFFQEPLEEGHCMLLLDGLDEVADFDERIFVREIIEAFVARYPRNRYVLTCRIAGYRDAARIASGFKECRLREFDGEDMQRFAFAWNMALEAAGAGAVTVALRHKAERQTTDLLNAIDRNPRIRSLATNPLMLTVIALVHRYRATLPQRRVELYEECTELLLGQWDMGKPGEEAKWLAEWAGLELPLDASEKRSLLEPVARWYHENRLTIAEKDRLEQLLAARLGQSSLPSAVVVQSQALTRARHFLGFLEERSGLLHKWDLGHYAFSHLTFQEYLTARDIAAADDYVARILSHVDDSWWLEVTLLTAAHLSLTSRSRASQLVQAILESATHRKEGWWHAIVLAGQCLADIGPYRIDAKLWQDTISGLVWIAEHQMVPLSERHTAVTVLGDLGDPRLGNVVTVSGSDFLFGASGTQARKVFLPRFEIDRLPVTNAQFEAFIESGGYRTRDYWSEEGCAFLEKEGFDRPRFWDDPLWNRPNYPVVGVSWFEAQAYTNWAGGALPTEAQWEKAAGWDSRRGRSRKWPWGDEPTPEKANTSEVKLNGTTPVGLFPSGKSPCGVMDLAGNVWEWCANSYWAGQKPAGGAESAQSMALRGGSWRDDITLAQVASRDRAHPTARELDIGFRLVWAEE